MGGLIDTSVKGLLTWLIILIIILSLFIVAISVAQKKIKKAREARKEPRQKAPKTKKPKKSRQVEPVEEAPVQREQEDPNQNYMSPLIIDRAKYEIALQEKLERERQEKINRDALETARLEALKNKEFQSHAGYISNLQRFSKKDALEKQLATDGKVDRELLNTYLNEKATTISDEFTNMSPELKAVILSDLMKRKY